MGHDPCLLAENFAARPTVRAEANIPKGALSHSSGMMVLAKLDRRKIS
jgi:hypothetical protein